VESFKPEKPNIPANTFGPKSITPGSIRQASFYSGKNTFSPISFCQVFFYYGKKRI
jgi:hypothetical protein